MKRQAGRAVQIIVLLLLIGCATPSVFTEETTGAANSVAYSPDAVLADCAAPDGANASQCRRLEAGILASTVRLELTLFAPDQRGHTVPSVRGTGHATIVAGRYLVTHNHYGSELSAFEDGRSRAITIYRPDGQVVLQDVPYGSFLASTVSTEILVLDFRERGGRGLFDVLGLPSAPVGAELAAQVQAGAMVAQIDWDGRSTHVDWVRVKEVREENGIPVLVLDNFVEPGASGGGVFHEGYLLANNWFRSTERTPEGEMVQQYTAAALNETDVVALAAATDFTPEERLEPVAMAAEAGLSGAQ